MARQKKWYYKNEKVVMNKLGLCETPGSGNGWIHKEDGENEFILAQLKSTDKESITIKMDDWRKLIYHATVSNKIPIFVNEKIGEEILITLRPQDLILVAQYLKGELTDLGPKEYIQDIIKEPTQTKSVNRIKSSRKSRDSFWKERERQFQKRK